jgi:hypothetical protein
MTRETVRVRSTYTVSHQIDGVRMSRKILQGLDTGGASDQ